MNCWYMNGAGNDFMVVDARNQKMDFSALAKQLCALSGADGFMAVDDSEIADFRLHFYNADGSRGEMCGNGSRCVCRFAYEHGIAGETMVVETDAGLVRGRRITESLYRVQLNNPGVLDLRRRPDAAYVELGTPGVPHAVVCLPHLEFSDREALRQRSVALRHDPAFPKGANINFYTWIGPEQIRVLTYERGVEDYTLACGTGCGSTAAVLWLRGELPGGKLTAQVPGGTLKLTVDGTPDRVETLLLEGPTELVRVYEL